MSQRNPLTPSARKKLTEERYNQYMAWADDALKNGNRVWSEYYYQRAEYYLYLLHRPTLEVIHGPETLLPHKEGVSPSQKPNLRVIDGGKRFAPFAPSHVKSYRTRSSVIVALDFEEPSIGQMQTIGQAANQTSCKTAAHPPQKERYALYQMGKAIRMENSLKDLSKRHHPYRGQSCLLRDGQET